MIPCIVPGPSEVKHAELNPTGPVFILDAHHAACAQDKMVPPNPKI